MATARRTAGAAVIIGGVAVVDILLKQAAHTGRFVVLETTKPWWAVAIALLTIVGAMAASIYLKPLMPSIGAALIAGGGVANLGEHLVRGKITDMLRVQDFFFNMADLWVGMGSLALAAWLVHISFRRQ